VQVKTRAIVISTVKYQEKSLIVKCFTATDGVKSYFVRDAFSTRKSKQKIAYFQPLTLLEIEAVHKNRGTLESFKDIRISEPLHSIYHDLPKATMVMFIAEVLNHAIHEEERNPALFEFLESALIWLNNHNNIVNFHLILLLEVTRYLGFYPDHETIDQTYFELQEGVFNETPGSTSLNEPETQLLRRLMALKFDDTAKTFHVSERQQLLKILIDYYTLHLTGFRRPKSADIFKEIFS
jgi:DNA repair protein RecO (recombination protein O)